MNKSNRSKYFIVSLLVALPSLILIGRDFIYYRRGWHDFNIQITLIEWLAWFVITPLVLIFFNWVWIELNRTGILLFKFIGGLSAFELAHWGLSFVMIKFLLAPQDNRNWNLFNTIRQETIGTNVLVYSSVVFLYYAWIYFERHSLSNKLVLTLQGELSQARLTLSDSFQKIEPVFPHLTIKIGSKVSLITLESIVAFLANGPYVKILTTDGKTYLVNKPLYEFEGYSQFNFHRVHRSAIVKLDSIKSFKSLSSGDIILTLHTGHEVRASRTYKELLRSYQGKV